MMEKKLIEFISFAATTTTGNEPEFYISRKQRRHEKDIERLKRMRQ